MKFSIVIDQYAIITAGLKIDILDAAILDYISGFSNSGKMKKIIEGDEIYYWVSYAEVIRQLPMLRITSKKGVFNRFKNLCDQGILKAHKENQVRNASFYCFTVKYEETKFLKPMNETSDTSEPNFLAPRNQTSDNYTIKDNCINTKEKILKEKKIQFVKSIIDYFKSHEDRYPKLMYLEFTRFWTEASAGKKMRFENEKFFEIPLRLSTWFQRAGDQKIKELWDQEINLPPLNQLLKTLF